MEFFTFAAKKPDEAPSSAVDTTQGAIPIGAGADARAEADSAILTRPRKKRRAGGAAGDGEGDKLSLQARIDAKIEEQLEAVHDEKAWGALLGLPATVARALTANDRWKLEKEERDTLGATGSAFSRTMMVTNPRTLAAFMLGSALLTVYMPRAIAQLEEMTAKKKEAERDAKAKQ